MTRSTIEPDPIEIKRTHDKGDYFAVDLLIHWDANQITVDDVNGESHQEWEYGEDKVHLIYADKPNLDNMKTWLGNNQDKLLLLGKRPYGLSSTEQSEYDNYLNNCKWAGRLNAFHAPQPAFGEVGEPDFIFNWPSQWSYESSLAEESVGKFNESEEVDDMETALNKGLENARQRGKKIGK